LSSRLQACVWPRMHRTTGGIGGNERILPNLSLGVLQALTAPVLPLPLPPRPPWGITVHQCTVPQLCEGGSCTLTLTMASVRKRVGGRRRTVTCCIDATQPLTGGRREGSAGLAALP
jgi:hypothetical protein